MMRRILLGVLVLTSLVMGNVVAQARIHKPILLSEPPIVMVNISISRQTLDLSVNGWPSGNWQISSAGVGYHTPRGTFHVQRMAKVWFSKKYDNSPMPNSLFFDGGIAIHGTYHVKNLGRPVSHGCVRLLPQNAEKLFELAKQYGPSRVQITVTD
ncbi:MAG TPA: L,D-transpeptidase [Aestuariivirga sp.]